MFIVRKIILLSLFSFSITLLRGQNEAFRGGNGDGYAGDMVLNMAGNLISIGGNGDGYDSNQYINNQHTLSHGGFGDGYAKDSFLNINTIISHGGSGDGYSSNYYLRIYWTGNTSTAWNTGSNWSSNTKPLNADHVIIPAGRTIYPLLGNSLLSIGDENIATGFRCASLLIEPGGQFSGKTSTTLVNWSTLTIEGQLFWQNTSPGAIENKPGSKVLIKNGASLEIK